MKKLMVIISSLLMILSTNSYSKEVYTVGFAQDTMGNDWRAAQVHEVEKHLEHRDDIDFFYTDGKSNTAIQIMNIEDMIKAGVDVIITSPSDAKAMTPVIEKAYSKGIPVVLLSRTITSKKYTTFIHPDNSLIAEQAAGFIVNALNGKGNVLILEGVSKATSTKHRTEAFLKIVEQYPALKLTRKVANYLRSEAIYVIEKLISENYKFEAIYAQSDSMAIGAIMALKKHGIDPKKIVIVSIDYISEAEQLIKNGLIDVSYVYPTGGKEGAQAILKILEGKAVPKEVIIKSTQVTIDNVDMVKPIF
jgi:ribose transport system substrate-binding protein